MKHKIFLLLILFFNLSYPQRVVKVIEKTTKNYPQPSLDLFSGIYIFHLDSLYAIMPDGRLIKGGELVNADAEIFDIFIDTLTSQNLRFVFGENNYKESLVKYKIIKEGVTTIFWDTSYHLNSGGPLDPINKILLKKETKWTLKRFHWEDNYTIREDSIIEIIDIPEEAWQPVWLGCLRYWSIFRLTSFFYERGSIVIAINVNTYKIKKLTLAPGGPVVRNYAVTWERGDIENYRRSTFIRALIDESEKDINFKIIDTLFNINTCDPLGTVSEISFWGIDYGDSIKIIDTNNKILFKDIKAQGEIIHFGNVVNYLPSLLVFNAFSIINNKDSVRTYFKNRIFMIVPFPNYDNFYESAVFKFNLYQNYPNPFNPTTTIEFDIPERTNVKLVVYDILGREVETLIDKELEPGKYKVNFEAKDLPSSVYFYTLRTPKFTKTNKMILIK